MNDTQRMPITLAIVLACILVVLMLSAGYHAYLMWKGTTGTVTLQEASRLTTLKFPTGTRVTNSWFHEDWRWHEVKVRVKMPRAKLQEFIKTNALSTGITRHIPRQDLLPADSYPWWNPESGRKVILMQNQGIDLGHASLVFIHADTPHQAELYVRWAHD